MLILYFIIIFLILFYIIKINYKSNKLNKFYRCKIYKLNDVFLNSIEKLNLKRVDDYTKCNLFIPCNYSSLINEIKDMKFNKNQKLFFIDNCDNFISKSNLWILLEKKYGRENASKIMPETFILSNIDHINIFKSKYIKNKKYILKNKKQRKEGLYLTNDIDTILNTKEYTLVQSYIENIFTINNRKLNIRIFIIITCHNNEKKLYLYNEGKCLYTNKDYNKKSYDIEKNYTSLNLDYDIYNINPLSLKDLENYFINNNLSFSKFNLNLQDIIVKIYESFKDEICIDDAIKNNFKFELFGLDIILDNKMNLFILEINKGPSLKYFIDREKILKDNLYLDLFSLIYKVNNIKNNIGNYNNFILLN